MPKAIGCNIYQAGTATKIAHLIGGTTAGTGSRPKLLVMTAAKRFQTIWNLSSEERSQGQLSQRMLKYLKLQQTERMGIVQSMQWHERHKNDSMM